MHDRRDEPQIGRDRRLQREEVQDPWSMSRYSPSISSSEAITAIAHRRPRADEAWTESRTARWRVPRGDQLRFGSSS